jgi:hypothetical protein
LKGASARPQTGCASLGQLVEGTDGTHVWADKLEGVLEDVFDLQDPLTESIVGAIEPSLRRAEIEKARRKLRPPPLLECKLATVADKEPPFIDRRVCACPTSAGCEGDDFA